MTYSKDKLNSIVDMPLLAVIFGISLSRMFMNTYLTKRQKKFFHKIADLVGENILTLFNSILKKMDFKYHGIFRTAISYDVYIATERKMELYGLEQKVDF